MTNASPVARKNFFSGLTLGRMGIAVVIMIAFMLGYNATFSTVQMCAAQSVPKGVNPVVVGGPCAGLCQPCLKRKTAKNQRDRIRDALEVALVASDAAIEAYISLVVDTMVEDILNTLEEIENQMIRWWKTMMHYNLRPGMQDATEQINVATTDQSRSFQSAIDAEQQSMTALEYQEREYKAEKEARPSENVCVAGTQAGGLGRANSFTRAMRRAWQNESAAKGANKAGTPAALGTGAVINQHAQEFESLFCDPMDNGGNNDCAAADPTYYNADTKVTDTIYNKKTIPIDTAPPAATATEHILTNLTGTPTADPIDLTAVTSSQGIETWMNRRSYLARHNAVRSVPQLIAGWRVPGSGHGTWVKALRDSAGIALDDMSDNPSYKEIVHAVTVDRFNSGNYAINNIQDANKQQMEKLVINAFYLMQLRDYFELLERQALALAIQVAIMSDQYPLSNVSGERPLRP